MKILSDERWANVLTSTFSRHEQTSQTKTSMASKHGIRLPGVLLDELRSNGNTSGERFQLGRRKKRNAKVQLSRRETRKQQRQEKKSSHKTNGRNSASKGKEGLKNHNLPHAEASELPFSSDDELSSGDFEELAEGSESFDDASVEDHEPNMTAEETITALKALKDSKRTRETTTHTKKSSKANGKESNVERPLTPAEREAMRRDEMEMEYYAKKLGLKGKNKKIHARDEFDAIGGLLDGLDFFDNFEARQGKSTEEDEGISDQEHSSEGESVDELGSSEEDIQKPFSSDDELTSGDFDNESELMDDEKSGEEEDFGENKDKENPFIAPLTKNEDTYIPPSLRKKQLDNGGESEAFTKLRKNVKSSLNKLSDSNITTIISSLNDLFDVNARQYVTDAITKETLAIICQSNKLLDGFIMNYAAVAFSLWKLRGTEVGALFIQSFVETFLKHYDQLINVTEVSKTSEKTAAVFPKECSNIATLLAYCYNFGFISCKLIYDLIRSFVKTPNEFTTELLLKVVSISGPLIRGDDPSALKEIISALLTNVKSIKEQPVRLRFLLETMSDLKNNKLKPSMLASSHQPLKKVLQNVLKTSHSSSEPLQVSLDDIKNVNEKGKWWLVGASWKGNLDSAFQEAQNENLDVSGPAEEISLKDDLLEDIPDWSVIARQQRMNTDVRRAIFVSIMSAQDYLDAFSRLEKLNLKNKQTAEIPRVLVHCLIQDGGVNGYNPYYALLARKLCEYQHHLAKSFQFLFWDIIKKFEEEHYDEEDAEVDDDDTRLRSIASRGRFFGFLISEGIMPLDIFKHVSIISGLNPEGNLFVEVLLYQLLVNIAKKSETKNKDSEGRRVVSFKPGAFNKLITDGIKLENKSVILKGLKWFVAKKFKYKDYIGEKSDKHYERDLRRIQWAVSAMLDVMNKELEL